MTKKKIPYSRSYLKEIFSPGNLPFFLIMIKGFLRMAAKVNPNKNPLDSIPAIASKSIFFTFF